MIVPKWKEGKLCIVNRVKNEQFTFVEMHSTLQTRDEPRFIRKWRRIRMSYCADITQITKRIERKKENEYEE